MNGARAEMRVAIAIARKDAMAELRGRHAIVSTLFFAAWGYVRRSIVWGVTSATMGVLLRIASWSR